MQYLKMLGKIIGLSVILLLVLNWPYYKEQLNYYLHPPPPQSQLPPLEEVVETVEPNRIWIRSLGIQAPVVYAEERNEQAFQVALRNGVVHFPGTAKLGETGNVYLFGHSSDMPTAPGNYKTVFALLPKIETGALVEISDPEGKLYKYQVAETRVVGPSDLSVLEQDHSKKQLTLQTSYPLGTALRRFLVIAYLQE